MKTAPVVDVYRIQTVIHEYIHWLFPRYCWGLSATILWDGAFRPVLWGYARGCVCQRTAAHRIQ